MKQQIIEKWSLAFAAALFLISFIIIYTNTYKFLGSLSAAMLSATLGWVSFVIIRLTILALKK